ncbi:histone-lysine n-methyltransferase setmar-like protein [Trichonephila clavipes]|nr:histone-lysine n-methyltransferase setmar-like protein [Trichonephila clavipes]
MFHHDGAPAHTANLLQQFLTKHGTIQVAHPPYSPDMSPPDFFLFPKIKNTLRGHRFQDIYTIKQNSTQQLQAIPKSEFRNVSRTRNIVGPSVLLPMEHISKEIDSKPVYVCMFLHNKFSLDTF